MSDRLASIRVGEELPVAERLVAVEDLAAYAEASGDRNPLHLDDAFARSVGFPGVIAHGMFTLGHLASMLEGWLGADGEITALRAQFRSPVFPGDTVVARARVAGVEPATREIRLDAWVEVRRGDVVETPVRRGEATVRFAADGAKGPR